VPRRDVPGEHQQAHDLHAVTIKNNDPTES
jgi:hypothetical protein